MMRNQLWKKIPDLSPEPRSSHTSTLFQDYIITYSGTSDGGESVENDIEVLNLKTCSFEEFSLEGDQPSKREYHTACLFDTNKILVFGGYDFKNDLLLNDTAIISIEQITPLKLKYEKVAIRNGEGFKRCNHSADIYDNQMYVFGGIKQYDRYQSSNELWRLDLSKFTNLNSASNHLEDTFIWQICWTTGTKPEETEKHCSAIKNDRLYIFGGFTSTKKTTMEHFYILSFGTMKWEKLKVKEKNIPSRLNSISASFGDHLFIIGGDRSYEDELPETLIYNFKENTFNCSEANGDYGSRYSGAALAYNGSLIIWGGYFEDFCYPEILRLQLDQTYGGNLCVGNACSIPEKISHLLGSEEYSDVSLLVEGERIPAHKLVLCIGCTYFANLFKSKMKESHLAEIEIKDVKLQTFKVFLKFLYQSEVELTEPLALGLYELSNKYCQTELTALCEEFLSKHLTLDNFLSMIDFAERFGTTKLKQAILEFIAENLEEIKQNQGDFLIPYSYLLEVASNFQKKLKVMEQEK